MKTFLAPNSRQFALFAVGLILFVFSYREWRELSRMLAIAEEDPGFSSFATKKDSKDLEELVLVKAYL